MSTKLIYLVLIIVSASGITSCVVDEPDLSKYMTKTVENVEVARAIDVVYTDSSYKLFNLKAPLMRRVFSRYGVSEEFPEGIEVTFFDKNDNPRSWLSAETAERDQTTKRVIVRKNVVLRNDAGDVLHGPELIWDEKTKEISTDRFVKITRADGTLIYSYGFKSNESFTRYELNAVSGDMVLENENQQNPQPPANSDRPGPLRERVPQ